MSGLYEKWVFCTGPNHNKVIKFSFIDFLDDHFIYINGMCVIRLYVDCITQCKNDWK